MSENVFRKIEDSPKKSIYGNIVPINSQEVVVHFLHQKKYAIS